MAKKKLSDTELEYLEGLKKDAKKLNDRQLKEAQNKLVLMKAEFVGKEGEKGTSLSELSDEQREAVRQIDSADRAVYKIVDERNREGWMVAAKSKDPNDLYKRGYGQGLVKPAPSVGEATPSQSYIKAMGAEGVLKPKKKKSLGKLAIKGITPEEAKPLKSQQKPVTLLQYRLGEAEANKLEQANQFLGQLMREKGEEIQDKMGEFIEAFSAQGILKDKAKVKEHVQKLSESIQDSLEKIQNAVEQYRKSLGFLGIGRLGRNPDRENQEDLLEGITKLMSSQDAAFKSFKSSDKEMVLLGALMTLKAQLGQETRLLGKSKFEEKVDEQMVRLQKRLQSVEDLEKKSIQAFDKFLNQKDILKLKLPDEYLGKLKNLADWGNIRAGKGQAPFQEPTKPNVPRKR